jgi:hypothetical protein
MLSFRVTVLINATSSTPRFNEATFLANLARVFNTSADSFQIVVQSQDGVVAVVDFVVVASPEQRRIQSSIVSMSAAELQQELGVQSLAATPITAMTPAPATAKSLLQRGRSLVWVAGAGMLGLVAIAGIVWYVSQRRKRNAAREAAMWAPDNEMLLQMPVVEEPQHYAAQPTSGDRSQLL